MLESLVDFKRMYEKPYVILFWAFVLGSVGVLISNHISFHVMADGVVFNLTGIFAVIFTLIPSVYFMTLIIKREEKIEERLIKKFKKKSFWHMHEKDILILLLYFIGVTFAFAFWSFALPADAFQVQAYKINQIRGGITDAEISKMGNFNAIVSNNLQVMLFAFIFSFIFGAGAIFIIVWNASVLGVFIGQLSKGFSVLHIPLVSLSFWGHGIPEIAGYLFAALSGGLISAAIIRKNSTEVLRQVIFDALKLLLIAIALFFLAGAIEVM